MSVDELGDLTIRHRRHNLVTGAQIPPDMSSARSVLPITPSVNGRLMTSDPLGQNFTHPQDEVRKTLQGNGIALEPAFSFMTWCWQGV